MKREPFGLAFLLRHMKNMLQYSLLASVAEWSIAADCKSAGFMPTLVQIQPGAQ